MDWRIWFELYEGDTKIGAGVWHYHYKHRSSAVRRAEQQFGKPRVNKNTGKIYTYKWVVSQTNPRHE